MRLRVASYNVHGCVGRDGRRDVARVARVIGELRADVIGLQEVDSRHLTDDEAPTQLAELAGATGTRGLSGPTLRTEQGEYGNAILSRLPVHEERSLDLSVPGYEPRGALAARLDAGVAALHAVVTHFGLRWRERREQLDRLLFWLEPELAGPTVLFGDLNEWWYRSQVLRRLGGCFAPSRAVRTFPAHRPLLALDRMFASGARLEETHAHRSPLARTASDHLPVVSALRFG